MILLKKQNLLFVKGYKVAGTSFEIALSKFANDDDIITPIPPEDELIRSQLGFKKPQNYRIKKIDLLNKSKLAFLQSFTDDMKNFKFSEHISAVEIRKILGKDYFDNLTKVAIIRNPFDYLVSRYYWEKSAAEFNNKKNRNFENFETWMKNNPSLINQNNKIYKDEFDDLIDIYIKFENLDTDLKIFETKFNLPGFEKIFNSIKTKSNIRSKTRELKDFYNNKSIIECVKFLNNDDIKRFNYKV